MPGSSTIRNGPGHRAYRRKQAQLKRRTTREGLTCTWCGGPFDLSLTAGDRMSFTADHPTGLADGGHLVNQELEPFHMICNIEKHNQGDTEIWSAS